MDPTPEQIAAGLERIRRRERTSLTLYLTFVAFLGAPYLLSWAPHSRLVGYIAVACLVGSLAAAAGWVVFILVLGWSICPRCGGFFYITMGWRRWRQCAHCGLSLRRTANEDAAILGAAPRL